MSTDNPAVSENLIAAAIEAAEEIRDPLDGLVEKTANYPGAPLRSRRSLYRVSRTSPSRPPLTTSQIAPGASIITGHTRRFTWLRRRRTVGQERYALRPAAYRAPARGSMQVLRVHVLNQNVPVIQPVEKGEPVSQGPLRGVGPRQRQHEALREATQAVDLLLKHLLTSSDVDPHISGYAIVSGYGFGV
jgi:hypothetical protein